jgi:hypothetical protein
MARRPAGNGPSDPSTKTGELEQFGPYLEDTAAHVEELGQSLSSASARFAELEQTLASAREAEEELLEAANRATSLEQELAASQEEREGLHLLRARDQEALAEESKRREEFETSATEALARNVELEQEIGAQRERADSLQAELTHAEAAIAAATTEANSARLRAEAAKRDSEAARLEGEATRHDVEAARLEAEATRHDVESARLENEALRAEVDSAREQAKRFRDAAELAFEQMQAMRSEWATGDEGPTWLAQVLSEEVEEEPTERAPRRPERKSDKTETSGGGTSSKKVTAPAADPEPQAAANGDRRKARADEAKTGTTMPLVWSNAAKLALTGALGDCTTKRELLEAAGRVVGSRGGWDAVIAWTLDTRAEKWVLSTIWSAKGDEPEELMAAVGRLQPDGKTAVAGAAANGKFDWFHEPFPVGDNVLAAAGAEGMKTVAVMPLGQGDQTRAVIALCSQHEGNPSEELQRALTAISTDVSSMLGEMRAADAPPRWGTRRRR